MSSRWETALAEIESESAQAPRVGFWEFFKSTAPSEWSAPRHLRKIVSLIQEARRAARGECPPVFACTSVPPQHGKTTTFEFAFAHWLKEEPERFLAYVTYNQDQANDRSRNIRDIVRMVDVELKDDAQGVRLWRTPQKGGLLAAGLGGPITGKSKLDAILIDDPFKDESEALSRRMREKRYAQFSGSVWSRLHRGTSVFVNHTRWHVDDMIGRIQRDPKLSRHFRFVNFPAIDDRGEALWPELFPLEVLERKRDANERQWWSLYMGQPRSESDRVFGDPTWMLVDETPNHARFAIGVDLAYSAKTSSDWCVAAVMARADDRYYLLDVVRRQCRATDFVEDIKRLRDRYGARVRFYGAGQESEVVEQFRRHEGLTIDFRHAGPDKLVRATPVSDAWNDGRVLVHPRLRGSAALDVVADFSGIADPCDDDVDAIAAAYDTLSDGASAIVGRLSRSRKRAGRRLIDGF